jgi:hypothetical protein
MSDKAPEASMVADGCLREGLAKVWKGATYACERSGRGIALGERAMNATFADVRGSVTECR